MLRLNSAGQRREPSFGHPQGRSATSRDRRELSAPSTNYPHRSRTRGGSVPDADPDADRFTRLYEAYYRRVVGYALRRAAAEVAREVADESFLIAWRRLPDVPEPALPWLLVTARNLLGDHHRSGRRADVLLVEAV